MRQCGRSMLRPVPPDMKWPEAMTRLPRAMLIDMDDTILSAYGRPEIAWHNVAAEFAAEFGPLTSQQVATALAECA